MLRAFRRNNKSLTHYIILIGLYYFAVNNEGYRDIDWNADLDRSKNLE
jgi:hypothetical protein